MFLRTAGTKPRDWTRSSPSFNHLHPNVTFPSLFGIPSGPSPRGVSTESYIYLSFHPTYPDARIIACRLHSLS
jgi:hypothetical protein